MTLITSLFHSLFRFKRHRAELFLKTFNLVHFLTLFRLLGDISANIRVLVVIVGLWHEGELELDF